MAAGVAIVLWGVVTQASADRELTRVRDTASGHEREVRRKNDRTDRV